MNWTWLFMFLEIVAFLILSAVMWLVIKNADKEPVARGADRLTRAGAITDRYADEPTASQRKAA